MRLSRYCISFDSQNKSLTQRSFQLPNNPPPPSQKKPKKERQLKAQSQQQQSSESQISLISPAQFQSKFRGIESQKPKRKRSEIIIPHLPPKIPKCIPHLPPKKKKKPPWPFEHHNPCSHLSCQQQISKLLFNSVNKNHHYYHVHGMIISIGTMGFLLFSVASPLFFKISEIVTTVVIVVMK